MRKLSSFFLSILLGSAVAYAVTVAEHTAGGTAPVNLSGLIVLSVAASCPTGTTDVTATHQGFYLGAKPATGTAGDTLGSAIATSATDLTITAASNACATANATTGVNFAACSPAFTPTITMGSTADARSELAPVKWFRLCQL